MSEPQKVLVGYSDREVSLLAKYGNRHGLIAGATGTGKTVTLQTLAEGFSDLGTPVFMADVKGDLSGLCQAGGGNPKVEARLEQLGLTGSRTHTDYPVVFWDLWGQQGHPIRTTISEMGPLLLARLMNLNDVQEGVLNLAFKLADDEGLLLLDLKDLRSMLTYVAENASQLTKTYGNVSAATVGTIQRNLLVLEEQGADQFFGEPALELNDLMRTTTSGRGYINILAADKLMQNPRLYSTFLLWLLSELFEELPEVGDPDHPKLVFFFDEAHLLFSDSPPALVQKVEQVVRLIRSKGVGVYWISQNPLDIPDTVLGQLGNRVQHALRAFTPRDQKAVASAADTFRVNPKFSTAEKITTMGVGVALVSCLEDGGVPMEVQETFVVPPKSRIGPCDATVQQDTFNSSPVGGKYDKTVDRESAHELLQARAQKTADELEAQQEAAVAEKQAKAEAKAQAAPARRGDSVMEAMAKSVLRSAGSQLGRSLVRGVLGGLLKPTRRR
jgi:DNA helicase HerA-like ATPase